MKDDDAAIAADMETTSATAVNPYKQQSTLRSGGGNDVKEETWQMGRQHDDGWQMMDDGY